MNTEQARELASELGKKPGAPDVDETLIPALEMIPEPELWTLDQGKRLLILAPDLLYIVDIDEQAIQIGMLPASRDDRVTIKVTTGPRGPLGGDAISQREWSFDFGERRGRLELVGRERTMDKPCQDPVEQFARKLAERLGWPGLPIIENAG